MESTQQVQQPPHQRPPRPRLERPQDERAIAGVASGLARYLNIDVAWIRIAFVVSALFGGTGVLAYLIGWLAIPEAGRRESIAADKMRSIEGAGSWIGVGLVVLAGLIVLGNTDIIGGELLFAAVLVGVGVLLYRGDIGRGPGRPPTGSDDFPSSGVERSDAEAFPVGPPIPESATGSEPQSRFERRDPDPAFRPRPVAPRESSPLGRFALAATLMAVGIIGVGQSAGWFQPELRHYAAAVFVIFGLALLVSSLWGRARWLIVIGLLLAPFLVAMALVKVPLEGGFGDPRYVPNTAVEVPREYRLIAGEMVLDLTELSLAPDDVLEVAASVAFGRLEVIVPPDLQVNVLAKVDAGEIFLDGARGSQSVSGGTDNINLARTISYDGVGRLDLEIHVGFGEVEVHQIAEVSP